LIPALDIYCVIYTVDVIGRNQTSLVAMITTDYIVYVMGRNQTSLVAMITTDYTVDVKGRNQTSATKEV
jgi:hypothetical protein